jgi:hypothetical protein
MMTEEVKEVVDPGKAADEAAKQAVIDGANKSIKELADAGNVPPEGKPKDDAPPKSDDKAKTPKTKEVPAPVLSKKQMEAVTNAGFDEDDVKAWGDKAVDKADRLAKIRSDTSRLASESGTKIAELEAELAAAKSAKVSEKGDPPEGISIPTVDDFDDDPDEATKKMIPALEATRRQVEELAAKVAKSSEIVDAREAKVKAQEEAVIARERDEAFSAIDKTLYPELGDGQDLTDTEQFARDRLDKLATSIQETFGDQGTVLTKAESLQKALAADNPEKYAKLADVADKQKIEAARRGSPEAPTGREHTPKPLTAAEKVEARINGFVKKQQA